MANKFKLWVEDENINATQTYNDFDSDTQRAGGFVGGTPASAIRVNTALRQANLIACALMDVVAPNDNTIDFRSSRADTATFLGSKLKAYIGFSVDENGVLKYGSDVVPRKHLIIDNIDATGSLPADTYNQYITVTIPNLILEENKHYIVEGLWEASYFKTRYIYDYYTKKSNENWNGSSMNVIISKKDATILDFALVTISPTIAISDSTNTTLNFSLAMNSFTDEAFTSNNTVHIYKIWEVIE